MATGYEEVRKELEEWDIDCLLFGLKMELSLMDSKAFDEGLVLVYIDVIAKKIPPTEKESDQESNGG